MNIRVVHTNARKINIDVSLERSPPPLSSSIRWG